MRKTQRQNNDHVSSKRPFGEHLHELKNRVIVIFVSIVIGTIVGYYLKDNLLHLLISPLHQPLFYSSPAGGFTFTLSLSVLFGILVSIPVFVYELLQFLSPALPHVFHKNILLYSISSVMLMLIGVVFAYFVSLPAALHFLNTFTSNDIKSLISTSEYISFVTHYVFGFGILFQLPLVLLLINEAYPLKIKTLLSFQRYVIVLSFVLGAILTPTPDPFNQTLMAIPIILLYYVSLFLVFMRNKRLKKAGKISTL